MLICLKRISLWFPSTNSKYGFQVIKFFAYRKLFVKLYQLFVEIYKKKKKVTFTIFCKMSTFLFVKLSKKLDTDIKRPY